MVTVIMVNIVMFIVMDWNKFELDRSKGGKERPGVTRDSIPFQKIPPGKDRYDIAALPQRGKGVEQSLDHQ